MQHQAFVFFQQLNAQPSSPGSHWLSVSVLCPVDCIDPQKVYQNLLLWNQLPAAAGERWREHWTKTVKLQTTSRRREILASSLRLFSTLFIHILYNQGILWDFFGVKHRHVFKTIAFLLPLCLIYRDKSSAKNRHVWGSISCHSQVYRPLFIPTSNASRASALNTCSAWARMLFLQRRWHCYRYLSYSPELELEHNDSVSEMMCSGAEHKDDSTPPAGCHWQRRPLLYLCSYKMKFNKRNFIYLFLSLKAAAGFGPCGPW